jgi:hypothetical protein
LIPKKGKGKDNACSRIQKSRLDPIFILLLSYRRPGIHAILLEGSPGGRLARLSAVNLTMWLFTF